VTTTPATELPAVAAGRLGIGSDQVNVLLRVTLRHPDRTLTRAEANEIREEVYAGLHAPRLPV
jgi:phenylalanyl-tRNA synthetase alpha chain